MFWGPLLITTSYSGFSGYSAAPTCRAVPSSRRRPSRRASRAGSVRKTIKSGANNYHYIQYILYIYYIWSVYICKNIVYSPAQTIFIQGGPAKPSTSQFQIFILVHWGIVDLLDVFPCFRSYQNRPQTSFLAYLHFWTPTCLIRQLGVRWDHGRYKVDCMEIKSGKSEQLGRISWLRRCSYCQESSWGLSVV